MTIPRILIIAGSDSGGGAGIQADIKAVTMLGGHAMTAITAITAQNTLGVQGVMQVPAEMVLAQIDSVVSDIGVDAVKIGMIGSAETAQAVAERLEILSSSRRTPGSRDENGADSSRDPGLRRDDEGASGIPIVFDPVMVTSSGSVLADEATVAAFERLMRVATLVTPNLPELAALTGRRIGSADALREAGAALAGRTGAAVLAKGGHLEGALLTDVLVAPDGTVTHWQSQRIETRHTHGTGCTLASAIACGLGRGHMLVEAVASGRRFTRAAIEAAPGFGAGHGPMGHALGRVPFEDIHNLSS